MRWTELPVGPFKARTVFTYVDEIGGETLGSNPSHSLDERIAHIAVPRDLRERRSNRQGYVGHPARLGPRRSRSTTGRPAYVRRKVRAPPAAPAALRCSVLWWGRPPGLPKAPKAPVLAVLRPLFNREDAPFSPRRRRSYLCSSASLRLGGISIISAISPRPRASAVSSPATPRFHGTAEPFCRVSEF